MGWKRQKPVIAPVPAVPSLVLWLIVGLASLFTGSLLFVLHANQLLENLQKYNPWVVSVSPLMLWFTAVCLRGWLYNNACDRHQFESDEAEYGQQKWAEWAGRYLAVLHRCVLLPGSLTPSHIIAASTELQQHYRQVRRISWNETQGLEVLIAQASNALQRLPAHLPINVTLLTDSVRAEEDLQAEFTAIWQRQISDEHPAPSINIFPSRSLIALEERLKTPEISVELILIEQLQGKGNYSDALAMLLLTTDDVSNKYQLEHPARLLRPMLLNNEHLHGDLSLFFSTQTQANGTTLIIGDSAGLTCDLADLLRASEATGGKWNVDQLHWLERYTGISGPLSPWIMAAVTSDVVALQQADCLMLSSDRQQRFINTVTTGNQNAGSR